MLNIFNVKTVKRKKKKRKENKRPVDQGQYMVSNQQYPCPAFFSPDFPIVSRAVTPEGQCPVEYRG